MNKAIDPAVLKSPGVAKSVKEDRYAPGVPCWT